MNLNYSGSAQEFLTVQSKNESRIFFTVEALMSTGFVLYMEKHDNKIYTTYSAIEKIKKLMNSNDKSIAENAFTSLCQLKKYHEQQRIVFKGIRDIIVNPAQEILQLMIHYRTKRCISVVSCNKKLAHDILMLNKLKSSKGYRIHCYDLSNGGLIYDYEPENYLQFPDITFINNTETKIERKGA